LPDQLFFDIVKMVVALAFVLGLAYGVVYLMKRLLPGVSRPVGERVDLQLVSQVSVGSRQKICVLRVQGRTLVLGVTEGSINTLAELTAPAPDVKKEADDPKIFADLLAWKKDAGARAELGDAPQPLLARRPAPEPRVEPDDRGDGPLLFPPRRGKDL
jgi:flagellar protein FliO/FliZ